MMKRALLPSALSLALVLTAGCYTEDKAPDDPAAAPEAPQGPVSAANYAGPGSNWEYQLFDDMTFTIARSAMPGATPDLVVNGTYSATAGGFVVLSVLTSDGSDAPPRGTTLWGVEIPGKALVLGPVAESDDNLLTMVDGSCPGADISANWVNVRSRPGDDAGSADGSYFGSLSYARSNNETTLTSQYALTVGNPDQGSYSLGVGFCRDGVVTTPTSDVYLSTNGSISAQVDASDPDGGFYVLALPKTTLSSISDLDGSYAGALADHAAAPGSVATPVVVNCSGGLCTGQFVTDVLTGAVSGESFSVDLSGSINVPGMGMTTGAVTMGEASGNLGCIVADGISGGHVLSCAGQSPTRGYALFNLILTSND